MTTYYVLCTPCLGDPALALWYPGSVSWAYVKSRRPPLFAAYKTTARRTAARIVRDAIAGFGVGTVPSGPAAPKDYTPQRGDIIVSVVAPLPPAPGDTVYPPLAAVCVVPDGRSVHEMTRLVLPTSGGVRRLDLHIRLAVSSILI